MCLEKITSKLADMHKNPINCFLHLVVAIVVGIALWYRKIPLVLIGLLIAVIGHIFQGVSDGKGKKGKKEKVKKRKSKKGALEISIGTIIIIVIAVTMLILGVVFVRSVMCGAIGLTGELNSKVRVEINELFDSTAGEVNCLGSGADPIKVIPGETNIVWCGIRADVESDYSVELDKASSVSSTASEIESWIREDSWGPTTIAPGDTQLKKVFYLNIPKNAPEELITLDVLIKKNGNLINSQRLDFDVSRVGFFKGAMC